MFSLTRTYKIRFFLAAILKVFCVVSATFSFIIPSSHIMKNIPEWNEISKQHFSFSNLIGRWWGSWLELGYMSHTGFLTALY